MQRVPTHQAPLRSTPFVNPRLATLGIEVMTLEELRARVSPDYFLVPERVSFFLIMLNNAGKGSHVVDFHEFMIKPGSLLIVRPGQIQHWNLTNELDGYLLLIDPVALSNKHSVTSLHHNLIDELSDCGGILDLSTTFHEAISKEMKSLYLENISFNVRKEVTSLDIDLCRSMLAVLLLRISRFHRETVKSSELKTGTNKIVRMFIQMLDIHLNERPTLQDLADKLGYSVSTINRACLAVAGQSGKQLIDARILLEAKRCLVHSGDSPSQIGQYLGFTEATNFFKFFSRLEGCSPNVFRRNHSIQR